jgi:hypothetical protein
MINKIMSSKTGPVVFLTEEELECFLVFKYFNMNTQTQMVNLIRTNFSNINDIERNYNVDIAKSIEEATPIPAFSKISSKKYSSIIFSSSYFMNLTAYKYANGKSLKISAIDTMIQITNSLFPTNITTYINKTNIHPIGKILCKNVRSLSPQNFYKVVLIDDTENSKKAIVAGISIDENKLICIADENMLINNEIVSYNSTILCSPDDVKLLEITKLEPPRTSLEEKS